VTTFTVNSANTDEYKTIVIPADVTGTWATDTSIGIELAFDLGTGSTRSTATTNAWQTGDYFKATGSVSLVGTLNATFGITGVQLEKGSTATLFEFRPYGIELALCQRYYQQLSDGMRLPAMAFSTTICPATWVFQVPMRAVPTFNSLPGTSTILVGGSNLPVASLAAGLASTYGYSTDVTVSSGATSGFGAQLRLVGGLMTASAEL
jgi:hypothetical protein